MKRRTQPGRREYASDECVHCLSRKETGEWPVDAIKCVDGRLATKLEPCGNPAYQLSDRQGFECQAVDFRIIGGRFKDDTGIVAPADTIFEEGVGHCWFLISEDAAEGVHRFIDLP